ncbi:hypothetical protein Tco_0736196, partial [Tanacetum coccineum]
AAVQNSNSSAQQDALILYVTGQLKTQVFNCTKIDLDNKSVNDTLTAEVERYKEHVKVLKEGQNVDLRSNDNFFYDHTTKQALGFQNPFYLEKAQQLEPKLYDGNVIEKTNAIVIPDSEETLMLAEESRSKILLKQKDPIMLEKKFNTTPVDYAVLNQLSQYFETRFVPQTELSAEQAFWSQNFVNYPDPTLSSRPIKVEVPKEVPKVSMVNTSLKKLKHHLAGFDMVVKERTTTTTITEGSWGFKHTKACFRDEIIPFVKALKDLFNTFDQYLIDELSEVQNVFHQMEQAVEQHRLESKTFEEKVLVITDLKDELRKLKGKALVDNTVTKHTIDLEMLKNNRTTHSAYIKHTQEEAVVLRDLVEHVKSNYPLVHPLESICRITTTTEVPLRKPTALESDTPKPVVTLVYSRKPKKYKTNVPVSKPKNIKSLSANKKEPGKSWGSIVSDVPYSSLDECRSSKLFSSTVKFGNDHVAKILGYGDYQIGNVMISRVYYVEGLGHNLFFVGQFCDSNLKTCNNDKNLSEIQLEQEKEDEFVVVVVVKVVLECRHWMDYCTLRGRGGESFWEGGDDFRVDVLRFYTCLTDILGFLEKLEWWFEQDIAKEEERFKGDEDGSELDDVGVPLFSVSKPCSACSRVFIEDIYGDHAISSGKEVDIGLDGGHDKKLHPADMLLYSWDGGLDVCVDLTGSSPLTQTGMSDFAPGRAVTDAAQRKRGKYMTKCADIRYGFLPFSFSSFGELEKDAVTLLKRVRNFSMAQDIGARAASHIFNRIGFSIAKGVGAQIVSRLPSNVL